MKKLTFLFLFLLLLVVSGCEEQIVRPLFLNDIGLPDTYYLDVRTLNNDTVALDFSDQFDANGTFFYRVLI